MAPPCHGYANCCSCLECRSRSANFPKRLSPDKEVRQEIELLRRLGFFYMGPDSRGHHCFEHEEYGEIVVANTPSSRQWRKRQRHRLARLMGLSRWELEQTVAGQPLKRSARRQGNGPRSPESYVMEHAMALGIPCDRLTASRVLGRFGSVRASRKALDGMAAAAMRREAA